MINFFYNDSDYVLFQKAYKEEDGKDVVVELLSTDESLNEKQNIVTSNHIVRKDSKFKEESSFSKFFGPRRNNRKNIDTNDFASWRNKNYRETENEINQANSQPNKFSFRDFMNERAGNKIYNDADENISSKIKPIEQLDSNDELFKKFSLNDYMRRLEEKTRVKNNTTENEDLVEIIETDEEFNSNESQDEDFEKGQSNSNIDIEKFAGSDDFEGDKYSVDSSELDYLKDKLDTLKTKTDEINKIIDEKDEDDEEFDFETIDDEDDLNSSENDVVEEHGDKNSDSIEDDLENDENEKSDNNNDDDKIEEKSKGTSDSDEKIRLGDIHGKSTSDLMKLIEKNEKQKQEVEEKLKKTQNEKSEALKNYEKRLKELEDSIKKTDDDAKKRALSEKIKNDNKLKEVKTEFKQREAEIRKLEKESALKARLGIMLKKELKNNLKISNLEMNNKLLEISSKLNNENRKNKVKKTGGNRKSTKKKKKIDSDIIGGIKFD